MRLAVLGDSHAAGLGVYGRSFAVRLADRLDHADLLQLARTTRTVDEIGPEELARLRSFGPDLVLVCVGAAEALVHPSRLLQRLLDRFGPKSWRGVAGCEPRPYYSRSRGRRWRQRAVSAAKVLVKRTLIAVTGGYHRVPAGVFEARLRELLDRLDPNVPKILVGLWPVDGRTFPRSGPLLSVNDGILRSVAAGRADVLYVPTAVVVRRWADYLEDHAHLNDEGHDRVADLILRTMTRRRVAAPAGGATAS